MKRDMDLVRLLLLEAEKQDEGFSYEDIELDGYDPDQIAYHLHIMWEGRLFDGVDHSDRGCRYDVFIKRLTWEGHEFLEAVREADRWNRARTLIAKAGGATVPVWTALLTAMLKQGVGL